MPTTVKEGQDRLLCVLETIHFTGNQTDPLSQHFSILPLPFYLSLNNSQLS